MKGAAIRAAREDRGLSVRKLARLAGVHHTTLLRVERTTQAPTARTVTALKAALNQDAEELALVRRCVERGSREHLRDVVRWEEDPVARYVVAVHPDGLTGDQVAAVMGLDPRTIDAVEARALGKLRRAGDCP